MPDSLRAYIDESWNDKFVVLAGFTHRDAASALDISLATLIARLTKARERITALIRPHAAAAAPRVAAPHLRVVK